MAWCYLGKKKTYALVDSGADISLISREMFNKIAAKNISEFSTENCIPLQSVSGHKLENFATVVLEVKMSKFSQPYRFQIVDGLRNSCILGNDFLSDFGAQLDFGQKTLNIEGNVIPLRPQRLTCESATSLVRVPQKVTIEAQSYIEVSAKVNRAQLYDQECLVEPLNNVPIFADEPGLCLVSSVGKVNQNGQIPVVIVNTSGRNYTLPARSVIGLAEVLEEPEVCISSVSEAENFESESSETVPETQKADLSHVSEAQREKLEELLERNADLFAKNDCDLGRTDLVKAKIDTGSHPPIKQRPYRLPFSQRKLVEQHIQDMLKAGVIEPSQSPWASPIVIVDKKDGTKRFCVDYRALNKIAKKNSHPLPRIDDILASLEGAKYFTCLDLRSGYWQIEMADSDSKERTAFTSFMGLYCFKVMPFGLCQAGSFFQELMNKVLNGIQNKFTFAYLDDIIIFSKTFEEHLEHVETVFSRLREAGLKLKMKKCDFLKQEVKYLGHLVSSAGVKPDPEKVSAIKNMQPPTNVKGVRSFLGMCGFYRRFVPNYAKIAKPLTELTKKHRHFRWTDECQKAFEILRDALTEAPILAFPDINKPYKVYTDASNYAIGAALVQETELGERIIQYLSHQLNETQQRWPIIEKEAYAIIYNVQKFRPYLLGSKFTIMTDHKPLSHLFTSEMHNARVQRWAIILDEYGADVSYVKGSENVIADALSRLGPPEVEIGEGSGLMTRESSIMDPANYASRKEGAKRQSHGCMNDVNEATHSVNVIDSDHAPAVQLETKVGPCEEREKSSKEKFREFLENHPDFKTIQSEDAEIQKIVKILGNSSHSSLQMSLNITFWKMAYCLGLPIRQNAKRFQDYSLSFQSFCNGHL